MSRRIVRLFVFRNTCSSVKQRKTHYAAYLRSSRLGQRPAGRAGRLVKASRSVGSDMEARQPIGNYGLEAKRRRRLQRGARAGQHASVHSSVRGKQSRAVMSRRILSRSRSRVQILNRSAIRGDMSAKTAALTAASTTTDNSLSCFMELFRPHRPAG